MNDATTYIIDDDLEFLEQADANMAGCVLLNVRMPDINGMELLSKLKQHDIIMPVIIVTSHADVAMAVRAMKTGAFDFIEKPYNDALMLERVQSAITQDQNNRLNQQHIANIKDRAKLLTPREQEVMRYVLSSTQNKIIAVELGISIKTVELHRANLMTKMQAKTSTELMKMALIAEL